MGGTFPKRFASKNFPFIVFTPLILLFLSFFDSPVFLTSIRSYSAAMQWPISH